MLAPIQLIALHGNGGGGHRFKRTEPYWPADVRFTAVTLPGFADRPTDPTLQTVGDYALALHAEMAAVRVPEEDCFVLGTGIGGSLALELAQRYEEELAGLILHAPVGARLDQRRFPRLMRHRPVARLAQRLIAAPAMRPLMSRLFFKRPVPAPFVRQFLSEYGRCQVFDQMFTLFTADWFAQLRPTILPTALLWGGQERLLTPDHGQAFRALLPIHVEKVIAAWAHFPMIEQPAAFVDIVVDMIGQLQRRAIHAHG